MAKLGTFIKLAALASLIPYQFEKKEDGKSFSASALLWKVDYKAATEDENGSTNITIPGNLKEVAEKVKKVIHKEEKEETEAEFCDCANTEKDDCCDAAAACECCEGACACEAPCQENGAES